MTRKPLDQYYTEPDLAVAICRRIAAMYPMISGSTSNGKGPTILEPSAGRGAFVLAADAVWPASWIDAVELDPDNIEDIRRAGASGVQQRDFLTFERAPVSPGATYGAVPRPVGYDLIIGNPPYATAHEHIGHALKLLAPTGVLAFLLRLNLLSTRRFNELAVRPSSVLPIIPRPSFTGGGTDMTEYAVFIYTSDLAPTRLLQPLIWREKGVKKARSFFSWARVEE